MSICFCQYFFSPKYLHSSKLWNMYRQYICWVWRSCF